MITITILVELAVRYSNLSLTPVRLAEMHKRVQGLPLCKRPLLPSGPPHALNRRLSSEQVQAIVTEYQAGSSSPVLAEQFGIAKSSVLQILHQHGMAIHKRRGMSQEQVAEAVLLYEQGWSMAKIAAEMRVDDSTVYRRLKATGVATRDNRGRSRLNVAGQQFQKG